MSRKAGIVEEGGPQHKRPCALTDEEVFLLMQAYTADKTYITEADAMTLCHWAQAQKLGAYVLQLVLAGHLRVSVHGADVKVGLPPPCTHPETRTERIPEDGSSLVPPSYCPGCGRPSTWLRREGQEVCYKCGTAKPPSPERRT